MCSTKLWCAVILLFVSLGGRASSARSEERHYADSSSISYSGFIDSTFGHDLNDLTTHRRPYTTQPLYDDEAALNLGYVDAVVRDGDYHGRLAVQYGSSVVANYEAEHDRFFRYFQEAYAGAELANNVTLDVGIFFSHIGTEGWISRDNVNLGRSLTADYSPYYQSGARLLYSLTPEIKTELHLVRGWQNISNHAEPALGTRIAYSASPALMIQHSTFVGDVSGGRLFNHFGFVASASKSLTIVGAYDVGLQERRANTTAIWHGWAISTKYRVNTPIALGFRIERYSDPSQVLVTSLSLDSVTTMGFSFNLDYSITNDLVWRTEYRAFVGQHDIFPDGDSFRPSDSLITTSLQYSFAWT